MPDLRARDDLGAESLHSRIMKMCVLGNLTDRDLSRERMRGGCRDDIRAVRTCSGRWRAVLRSCDMHPENSENDAHDTDKRRDVGQEGGNGTGLPCPHTVLLLASGLGAF